MTTASEYFTMLRAALIFTLLLGGATAAQAAIYKTTDKDGNIVFTDSPPAGSTRTEKVEVAPVNTTPAPPSAPPAPPANQLPTGAQPPIEEQVITITTPAHEETIPMGPGNFPVAVKVKPRLNVSQALQLFVDGVPYNDPQRAARWELTNVFRGEHSLTVGIMGANGEITVMSEPVTVYVQRPRVR